MRVPVWALPVREKHSGEAVPQLQKAFDPRVEEAVMADHVPVDFEDAPRSAMGWPGDLIQANGGDRYVAYVGLMDLSEKRRVAVVGTDVAN